MREDRNLARRRAQYDRLIDPGRGLRVGAGGGRPWPARSPRRATRAITAVRASESACLYGLRGIDRHFGVA